MSVYDNTEELCKWLRDNSSGDYRPSAHAADTIEHDALNYQILLADLNTLKAERDELITQCSLDQEENIALKAGRDEYIKKLSNCADGFRGLLSESNSKRDELKEKLELLLTSEKKAFWWSAEFTSNVHGSNINAAWTDYILNYSKAQRNDTPVKSAAEIGRDAILAYSSAMNDGMLSAEEGSRKTEVELYRFATKTSEMFAHNLPNNGEES